MDDLVPVVSSTGVRMPMKPVLLPSAVRFRETSCVGAVGGLSCPPSMSPNVPCTVKIEPHVSCPMELGEPAFPFYSNRVSSDGGLWLSSSYQTSVGSLSPNSPTNSHSVVTNMGHSPASVSSYDTCSPPGHLCGNLRNADGNFHLPHLSSRIILIKEERSPNSVTDGCFADNFGFSKKKSKGPVPRLQEELCLVCGDRASGYHYNALTCEGCKGFFRRSINKNAVYQCKYGNNCEIDMYMRRKCQECRMKKCLNVGMRPECVVPEYQCAIKRESKKGCREKDKPNSTTKEGGCFVKEEKIENLGVKPLDSSQEEVINKLVIFQEEFESPSEDDLKKISTFPTGDSEEDSLRRFQHITEITILTVQLIVEFSKRVAGFNTLLQEDQITLLKACSSEVMMLRTARKYDSQTDSIVFANNQPYTRENYRSASVGDSADALFNFCRHMCMMKVDNAEYALLTAIVIFSERPSLVEPQKVEKIQEFYLDTLQAYVENHRPPGKNCFAKLLAVLTELRTLGNMNSEMCFSLKVQNKKLPPFLAEIWDVLE